MRHRARDRQALLLKTCCTLGTVVRFLSLDRSSVLAFTSNVNLFCTNVSAMQFVYYV